MIFCVFSFNRGRFLENCVESIEQCVPDAHVVIFDDDSTDPETCTFLASLEERHTVLKPGSVSSHRLGGLYDNMQAALDYCRDESLVCFLQDDTQVVRHLDSSEIGELETRFDNNPALGFISPCFIRGINRNRGLAYTYDGDSGLYFRSESSNSAGRFFSALLIMKPARLLEVEWHFGRSEPENERQAKEVFSPMGYLFAPFAMWLPEVPAYRGKRKTLGLRLAEKKRNCGYYPFRIMDEAQVRSLKARDPEVLPYAEDFLNCEPNDPPRPWAYNPLTGTGWLKTLNQIEVSLRRLFSA
ncbi:glycosyltransferase involved in cell wall biosynthesis [Halospina denitrificans]|uniref:Glycosyltransferase involved in cell wall biosynthesis n=1 Tax=Halospina denitrificans TaxID=332522 RepID=A0A4R7K0J3_9GAMM|nr:glycosyltransferase [Halospina denitrificans]TDT44342.1 glycosyltransferase involved in cell wall biosynthesis [Halospina denitrificans]